MGELRIDYKLLIPGVIVGAMTLLDNAVLIVTSLFSVQIPWDDCLCPVRAGDRFWIIVRFVSVLQPNFRIV